MLQRFRQSPITRTIRCACPKWSTSHHPPLILQNITNNPYFNITNASNRRYTCAIVCLIFSTQCRKQHDCPTKVTGLRGWRKIWECLVFSRLMARTHSFWTKRTLFHERRAMSFWETPWHDTCYILSRTTKRLSEDVQFSWTLPTIHRPFLIQVPNITRPSFQRDPCYRVMNIHFGTVMRHPIRFLFGIHYSNRTSAVKKSQLTISAELLQQYRATSVVAGNHSRVSTLVA